ncbi:MAG: SDR family NAD(P)-dependent oxidoreductase [Acidimicrobiales bacterium]|nr:SDR family NAD(P)-dependent oxidoreductase [Acidimicrobiales bacterium]
MSTNGSRGVAVITGASAGIGAATARRLAAEGFDVVVGARRLELLRAMADRIGARAMPLDVCDPVSVAAFCDAVPSCRVLVNNAGGALGLDPIERADEEQWRWMFEANVLGTLRATQHLLPKLEESGDGHVVMVGSIAGLTTYPGGAGYHAAKYAVRAFTETLRQELLGRPIRVTEVDPGMTETDFSVVRFAGDEERASRVYAGVEPLTADDIADCIAWAVTRPSHVNIDQIVVKPRDQYSATRVHRRESP